MKVLHVNQYYAPVGGAEYYLYEISEHLLRCGVDVAVVYAVRTGREFHVPGREEVHLECLGHCEGVSVAERGERIRRVVDAIDPDIIQVHQLDDPVALERLVTLRPTVQFVHAHSGHFCPGDGKFYRRGATRCSRSFGLYCLIAPYWHRCGRRHPRRLITRVMAVRRWLKVAPRLSRLIVASQYMKSELIRAGLAPSHIVVNPIGVDVMQNGAGEPESPTDEAIILFVGRLYEAKGPQILLAALERLGASCRAIFVGDGPLLTRLKERAERLSPDHDIAFVGWVDRSRLGDFYRRARVVVIPSIWPEPFGMVGVEAMAYGKPVVAFDVGGVAEWLKDGQNGFLIPANDVSHLAAAIERLLVDAALCREMGRRARSLAVQQFNIERHLDALLHIYTQAMETLIDGPMNLDRVESI